MSTINIHVQTTSENLAENIVDDLPEEAIIELIKQIDYMIAEYSFTEKLMKYFKEQIETEDSYEASR